MFDDARGGTIHACVQLFNALWPILSFLIINQFVNHLHKVSYYITQKCHRSTSFVILNPNSSLSKFCIHISHCFKFIIRKGLIIFGRKFVNPAVVQCHAVVAHSVRLPVVLQFFSLRVVQRTDWVAFIPSSMNLCHSTKKVRTQREALTSLKVLDNRLMLLHYASDCCRLFQNLVTNQNSL